MEKTEYIIHNGKLMILCGFFILGSGIHFDGKAQKCIAWFLSSVRERAWHCVGCPTLCSAKAQLNYFRLS